ncbi:hypothetical protein [Corynebacterium phoceense]|uniref:hypothetical protein n=1 Tax=Corynebacterium phoceense TaxID=1686286 RepID=UPI001DC17932|nr:hypothetical protein [Corynebacterium phoceense]HJG42954.1 hypothetical protein [Corynebacterium phoceense]
MALTLRLDLSSANVADLEALLAAARAGGIGSEGRLSLDGTELVLSVAEPAATQGAPRPATPDSPQHSNPVGHVGPVGEAAIRSVIDIVTGRQNPPRTPGFGESKAR